MANFTDEKLLIMLATMKKDRNESPFGYLGTEIVLKIIDYYDENIKKELQAQGLLTPEKHSTPNHGVTTDPPSAPQIFNPAKRKLSLDK
jgi:hypothetical protein